MTFPKQELLNLPVPSLNQTKERFLRSSRPLLTEEEYKVSQKLFEEFVSPGGVGEKLQEKLLERAATHRNWLKELWLNHAYLGFRSPLNIYSSTGVSHPIRNVKNKSDQLKAAAAIIAGILDFKAKLYSPNYPVDMMGKRQIDMSQYYKLFGACRIPGAKIDKNSFMSYENHPNYITVVHNYQFFLVPVYDENGKVMNQSQITSQLQDVVSLSPQKTSPPVGILTSNNRDDWYKAYTTLRKDPLNCNSLDSIRDSLFLICLDGHPRSAVELSAPDHVTSSAYKMMHGGGSQSNSGNRWADKAMQFVIGANGEVGCPFEHSVGDGYPIAVLLNHIEDYCNKFSDNNDPEPAASFRFQIPKKLKFHICIEIEKAIEEAKVNIDRLVDDFEINFLTYTKYGTNFIKSQKCSPDSYVQMALQLAFNRMHKVPTAQYEAAATRLFYDGRTETIRTCSIESVHFAKTMLNPSASNSEKVRALREALQAHKEYVNYAVEGQGVDRHLLGLRIMASQLGLEEPAIFKDPAFIRSTKMRLSTSQVSIKASCYFYFGPVVSDGYGNCYNLQPEKLIISITCFKHCKETCSVKFKEALAQSFDDMGDVFLKPLQNKI